MIGKKRNKNVRVLLLMGMMAVSMLQGCKEAEDVGNNPEAAATPGTVTEPVTPTEEPDVTAPVTPTMAPGDEAEPTPVELQRELPKYTLTVGNALYFEFAYEVEALTFRSENSDIVQASFMEGEYDWEEERETTGVMLYGIANGTTELVVTDVTSGQEVRWRVTVEKPAEESGKQKLIDWLLANGETNDIGDKELAEGTVEDGGRATIEYATMDENINFYFKEKQGDLKIEWNLIPTPEENTEYYITMRIGEDFVTATVDLATYAGESLTFEKGWFMVPVEEKMHQSAIEVSKRAYEAVRSLLV